jgi:hypothetical protein
MHRRSFITRILLASLAAPTLLAGSSIPALGHDSRSDLNPYGRVALRIPGRHRLISYFVILGENGPYGIDLRRDVPQMAAERLDLGSVPLLGQIFTPTLHRQFANATQVGSLYLLDKTIVLLPEVALQTARRHVWITHRKLVYRPPASIRPLPLKTPPTREQIRAAPRIGTAVLKDDVILGIVPPSALDDMDFGPPATA